MGGGGGRAQRLTPPPHPRYHVVHHQYAGVHWSKHKALYEKHLPEYKAAKATIFYAENLFVIFGCIVAKDYDKLADAIKGSEDKALFAQEVEDFVKENLESFDQRILEGHADEVRDEFILKLQEIGEK